MKKFILVTLSIILFSCGASKNIRNQEKIIKGNWTLSKITYSKTGNYNVTLFKDALAGCFIRSGWKFVPNNNTGIYTINDTNCNSGEREFVFDIQEINEVSGYYDFLLKPDNNNENNIGFRVELKELTETTMQWQQALTIDGEPFLINMDFIKQ